MTKEHIEVEAAQRPRDAVEDLLRQMVAQLGGINTRLRTFEGSVNRMEATVAGQGERLDNIDERLDSIDGHLTNLLARTFPTSPAPMAMPKSSTISRELGALLEVLGVRCNRTAERKRAAFFNAIGITLMAH
ncbi:hypothetical protein H9L39_16806 [Fusarium oxysporum f. sp. albedinis]|nr:hypothetical protein H9L39_16806 [Fusarium oxysporum f. sp. albedinis]